MDNLTKEAFCKAVEVAERCATPHGFFAAFPGYDMVFARDSMIISLGASLVKNEQIKKAFENSLKTLARNQSIKGQIPNAVDNWSSRKKHVDFKSIDSTLWFLIGEYIFKSRYKEKKLFNFHKKNIEKTLTWLSYQDMGEDAMLEQLPTTDWQDAFPHRYGHTINTQALYYKALNLSGKKKEAARLKNKVNEDVEDGLWQGDYYLSYRWKNHNKYKEVSNWFDSLGNLLAIVFELADKARSEKILNYIKKNKINLPFPMKSIFPSINKESVYWQDYYLDSLAGKPNQYLNGGIWTYIGGFYVCALVKQKRFKEAKAQLQKIAEANLKKPFFSEWLHGKTGKPEISGGGSFEGNQGWNAGMYIAAYLSVEKGDCLV